jgi:hypothetical protein
MIDITTIQTYPVPPKVSVLTQSNSQLKLENNRLKRTLIISGIVGSVIIAVLIIKNYNEYQSRKENKSKRY